MTLRALLSNQMPKILGFHGACYGWARLRFCRFGFKSCLHPLRIKPRHLCQQLIESCLLSRGDLGARRRCFLENCLVRFDQVEQNVDIVPAVRPELP